MPTSPASFRAALAIGLAVSLLVGACSGSEPENVLPLPTSAPSPTAAAEAPAPLLPLQSPTPPAAPQSLDLALEPAFPGLVFERLVGLYPLPDGNWLALEQAGVVTLIDSALSTSSVFLDITDRVYAEDLETGLLGLAVPADFQESKTFYVSYTAAEPLRSVLSVYRARGQAADPASERVVLEIEQPHVIHNLGQLVFGPDGYLYVGLGDGGGFSDPRGNGQDLGTLLGSLLRLDVNDPAGYQVPPDNPFVQNAGARPEIWAYGFRNPWRFSFDPLTGNLWLADTGQAQREEVNIIEKGGNYGWSVTEGSLCFREPNCSHAGLQPPIFQYEHADGNCAITGGFVYRGRLLPGLHGAYIFGDYCSGRIWALDLELGRAVEAQQILSAGFRLSSFARSNDGEIYVLEYSRDGGEIYVIRPR